MHEPRGRQARWGVMTLEVGIVLCAACRSAPPVEAPPPVQREVAQAVKRPDCIEEFQACRKDEDCILVAADCCGCAMGGRDVAIHRTCQQAWEDKLGDCQQATCSARFNCVPGAGTRCEANRCVETAETTPRQGTE